MFLAVNKASGWCFSKALLLFLLSVSVVSGYSYADKKKSTVQDLSYGTALYAYYQQDYFTALSELLIAEKKQSLQHHADFAEILRGGIHLSYGMDKEAEQLFYSAISTMEKTKKLQFGKSKKASNENIARAWFYLGKLLYKKGDYSAANEKFSKVSNSLTYSLRPEYAFLSASARQRLNIPMVDSEEEQFSPNVNAYSSWRFYTDYNQFLVALSGVNNLSLAEENTQNKVSNNKKKVAIAEKMLALAARINDSQALEEVEELLALQDQIYTAAGFLFLQSEKPKRAISSFKRIRQESVLVGQALLGYGWAAVNASDYQAALIPWQQLAKRSMLEPTTHEALLAVPFVYEKLNANAAALTAYDTATQALQQELNVLSDIQEQLKTLAPEGLQRYYSDKAVTWLDENLNEASDKKNHASKEQRQSFVEGLLQNRMIALLSQNHFNILEKQNQDVQWLMKSLNDWQTDLETVRFVVDARQARSAVAISANARDALQARFKKLKLLSSHLNAINKKSSDGVSVDSVRSLMNPQEKNSLRRIEHAEMVAERIKKHLQVIQQYQSDNTGVATTTPIDKEQLIAYKRKIATLKGLLHWQVSNDSISRQWQSQKILTSVGRELVHAEEGLSSLDELAEKSVLQIEERAMADAIQQRILIQQQQAERISEKINQKILALLHQDVESLKSQATIYLAQASLARARLLDTLSLDATPPDPALGSVIENQNAIESDNVVDVDTCNKSESCQSGALL